MPRHVAQDVTSTIPNTTFKFEWITVSGDNFTATVHNFTASDIKDIYSILQTFLKRLSVQ